MSGDLDRFIQTHLGVGAVNSPIWFIGPEPAGGNSLAEVLARVNVAKAQGFSSITNLRQDLLGLGETKWFTGNSSPTQPYWRRISHLYLAATGIDADQLNIEAFRKFQVDVLCSKSNEGPLMLETSALPAKGDGHWPYPAWNTGILGLESRERYSGAFILPRLELISHFIKSYEPKLVLLCGPTYKTRWSHLLRQNFPGTKLRVIPHPCAKGITHDEWTKLGLQFRDHL